MKLAKNLIKLTIFLTLLSSQQMAAHGEHKPGPHGGLISMPGAFHTEVLPYQNLGFKVYLLDINFENPTSKNSKLRGKVVSKGKEFPLKCTNHPDHFYCEIPKGSSVNEGELILSPEWNFQKGADVKHKLPLSVVIEEKKEHHHG
ncbi:hypothetical protein [Leptospira kanakyensis]|uniref:Uncharacterized protein n=1 Tax=Leptospira kanakyensis TaxID=2484968 RepID=A0A6N4Q8P3_9LEPT|nr:hypothetical protein [Leptospira kanakyensis]MCW7482797.1 hypothetical protein [Leptospira kanakyensis]TGK55494.1 hypothetical protein EHQ11_01210 [Leptospira kanakyensis]TGK61028.1 hypothetical protein EHQ16_09035 [Leptospira kanakyensis]TGK76499.1 hypothetical protein EHQ18_00615 [Leptospira kanakyensis]